MREAFTAAEGDRVTPDSLYDGPIIDAHHHLWDLSMGRHPWLTAPVGGLQSLGDLGFLRRDYMPGDYLQDARGQGIVASVCVEALWDRSHSPIEEVEWFDSLDRPDGIAGRYVAYAPLREPAAGGILEKLAANPRVVGVRETIRWHPDPAKRWAEAGLLGDPAWRQGLELLRRYRLSLDLLMNPYQAEEVAGLSRDFPDLQIIINHCGTPIDRDPDGIERWRHGLALMAAAPNIAIKTSNFGSYGGGSEDQRETVMRCIDSFGVERTMFGSDYPVARRSMSFDAICTRFKDIVRNLSAAEQRAVFHDNAERYYRFR
ncbi:amidohydrolase family protein [Pararoseomonas indoligenes]|uniref:Amidohydrolase family protein n=1 Tax=Roseomonas indoligenes TaxID=2820811 RepID=A0A940N491_9PROT|nr:amidohydrolase family protein [Pararoseomonas indoligenes]MBP0496314.1 amidohydrolase family protein [Pararoseomonas indoligenes]